MTDTLSEIENLLPTVREAIENRKFGNVLSEVLNEIQNVQQKIDTVQSLSETIELLAANMDANKKEAMENILEEIREIGDEMRNAASKEELEYVKSRYRELEKNYIGRFTREVSLLVEAFVSRNIRPLGALGKILRQLGETELGLRLEDAEVQARETKGLSSRRWPDHVKSLQTLSRELSTELHEITQNEDVDRFLLALSQGHASLAMVTPQVLKWLHEQGALEEFEVSTA